MRRHAVEIVTIMLALALLGWIGWRWLHPEERACAKVVKLCAPPDAAKSLDECRTLLGDEKQRVGAARARTMAHCALDSDDCPQVIDCLYKAGRKNNR